MTRLLLAILAAGYFATFVPLPSLGRQATFDPMERRGRDVERAIEESRFADAERLASQLARDHDSDPTIAIWQAEIARGLSQPDAEARAWERVFDLTGLSDAACPAMPEAYGRSGDRDKALDAYRRCAEAAPDDAELWTDLGLAYAADGRTRDADEAFERARTLDASNPRLPAGLASSDVRAQ